MGMVDVEIRDIEMSESFNTRIEAVVHAELERYIMKARDILLRNREFLEKVTDALLEKDTLLHSDVKRLREGCPVMEVNI